MSDHSFTAYHIYYHNEKKTDLLIGEVIQPFMKKHQDCVWFFIRYWEGGPHLRLRVSPRLDEHMPVLIQDLQTFMERHPSPEVFREDYYVKQKELTELFEDVNDLPWYEDRSVIKSPYVREIRKYGGISGVKASEWYFHQSSLLAVAVMRSTYGDYLSRLSAAFDVMLITASGLGITTDEWMPYFQGYADFWEKYLGRDYNDVTSKSKELYTLNQEHIVRRMRKAVDAESQGTHSNVLYQQWHRISGRLLSEYEDIYQRGELYCPLIGNKVKNRSDFHDAMGSICMAHIHMTNNRLGIIYHEEFILAEFICKALEVLRTKPIA